MTKYIHDEWCDVNLAAPSECSCYVRLIEALEGMVAYLEGSIPDDPRAEANLIDARRIRQERDDAVLAHHLALARIEALEEERDGLHAAMTVFEATWDTGGYMEPDEMWEKCWPAVDKFVPAEHQSLVWAVEQQGQERAALAAEGSSASGRYRVTRLTAEQMDTDVVVVPGETEDRAENDDPALAAKGKPTDE